MSDLQTMDYSLYDDSTSTNLYNKTCMTMSGESSRQGLSSDANSSPMKRPKLSALSSAGSSEIRDLKKSLTLDFTTPESAKKTLETPDVIKFLQLPSPELERFLTQGVAVVSTPTPTQFLFPKDVTAQQEQYARGFLDALNHIHTVNKFSPTNLLSPGFVSNSITTTANEGESTASTSTVTESKAGTDNLTGRVTLQVPTVSGIATSLQGLQPTFTIVQSPTKPGGPPGTSVIMQTVGFPGSAAFMQPNMNIGSVSAAMRFFNVKREAEDRPPSQSAEPGELQFTTLGPQARPVLAPSSLVAPPSSLVSSLPTAVTTAGFSAAPNTSFQLQQHHSPNPVQFVEVGSNRGSPMPPRLAPKVEEQDPQTVPNIIVNVDGSMSAGSSTAGDLGHASSFDMDVQDALKLERKRLRNRVAATKCRKRKIERITFLEGEVKKAEEVKREHAATTITLQDEVKRLRNLVEQHKAQGCDIQK